MAKSKGKKRNNETCGWKEADCKESPSTKMQKSEWKEGEAAGVNFKINSLAGREELVAGFAKSLAFEYKDTKLLNHPFQAAIISNFLSDGSKTINLVDEIQTMEWTRKQMDLYEFYQTTDLANVTTPYLKSFYNFINTDVRMWMQELTGMKFQKISASCSMYTSGDFLLSHDDLLTDRLIAFVFYLSPWQGVEKWTESMGGALELFSVDKDGQPKFPVEYKILPANNQFVFFKVEKKSHHQVGEVLTKDFPRLTINGWFHGHKDNSDYDADAVRVKKPNILKMQSPTDKNVQLEKVINANYLKSAIKKSIQMQIEENSEASLVEFLKPDYLDEIKEELKSVSWIIKGPANQQNYEILDHNSLSKSSKLNELLNLMASKSFLQLLHEFTELDLHVSSKTKPKCRIELQRWKGGCYTLIGDPSTYEDDTLDLIFYIGNNENIGIVNYLTPEETEDDEPVLLTIYPQNNSMNLVYRSSGTANFTKYCYKSTVLSDEFNYILFCSYKELASTISYILVIFVIGVPMWWKTTETHRATLPSSEISALEKIPIKFTMEVALFTHDDVRQKALGEELQAYFINNDVFNATIIPIQISREELANMKTPAMLEKRLLKNYEIKAGNLLVAEWKGLEDEVLVTSERTIFISQNVTSDKIYQVIRSWIVRDYKIRSILGRVKTFDGKQLRHNFPPPSPENEVLISVLNPRPDLQTLHWNVKKAIETYLQPFLVEFKDLSQFTLKSQWKYQLELKYESRQIQDDTKVGRHFAMEKDSLPQIVTSIERKLGTDVANKPCIHLVIYAPPCRMAPVYVYQGGKRVSNFTFDSFISAKWGGILLANPSDAVCSAANDQESIQEIYLNSHEIMDFVLYELRKILELEIEVPLNYAAVESLVQIAPRLWERDMFLRNGAIHLIASASSTLQSLIKLLDDIKNIVIGDHVGAEIHDAHQNVVKAKEFLASNEIQKSVRHALLAYIAAEKAFNDPSLLELLYFPEEQKYAVYIPLFLPIFIPVIFSLNSIKKYFKKDEQKKEKEEVVKQKDE